MKRIFTILLSLLLVTPLLAACGEQTGLQDGYYTAQAEEFSHGWREYITILVKGGSIVSVEYNAENASFCRARARAALTRFPGPRLPTPPSKYWPGLCWSRPGRGTPVSCL